MYECKYCNKTFKSTSSRNHHQRTAKYCLARQHKVNVAFQCQNCDKYFTTKRNLTVHRRRCDETQQCKDMENELQRLKDDLRTAAMTIQQYEQRQMVSLQQIKDRNSQIKELSAQLERLAMAGVKKPTTNVTNIQINNPLNLSHERVAERMTTLTSNHFVQGVKAVVGWIKDELLVDASGELLYRCTNPKDGTFRYMDENGELQRDCQGRKLISCIQKPFNEQGARVCAELIEELARIDDNDVEALTAAAEKIQRGHSTLYSLRQMKDNGCFVRELGVITS